MLDKDSRLDVSRSGPKEIWNLFDSSLCAMDYKLSANKSPWGVLDFRGVFLQNIDVFKDEGIGPRTILRSYRHILGDSARDYILSVPINARSELYQAGLKTSCEPEYFRIHSMALPFSGSVSGRSREDRFSQIIARVPGSILRQLLPNIDESPNLSIKIRPGIGKLMVSMLEMALAEGHSLSMSQSASFSLALIEAIASAVGDAAETEAFKTVNSESPHAKIRNIATEFIFRNLSNPSMNVAMVASHCQVSERYLHAAFASISLKIGTYIRHARLAHCRAALQNSSLRHRSITEIAISWGFDDPTSFSRTYKAWCGKSPREERGGTC